MDAGVAQVELTAFINLVVVGDKLILPIAFVQFWCSIFLSVLSGCNGRRLKSLRALLGEQAN